MDADRVLAELASGDHTDCLAHVERIPARAARVGPAMTWAPEISARMKRAGIEHLWSHQALALQALRRGENVVVSTGTASGKSLVYQLGTFERLLANPRATAIYLFPTKALANDQLRAVRAFALPAARAAAYDGDTPSADRAWVRRNANLVITNPDMLHIGILPTHERWAVFLRNLSVVVIDEMHTLRGVFGSHVAAVIRRLRRLAASYGATPQFIAASATIGNPQELAERLTGLPFTALDDDGSPKGEKLFALWNPPVIEPPRAAGASGPTPAGVLAGATPVGVLAGAAPARYSANSQGAALLAGLVRARVRTIAFARSRKGAELIATHARDLLTDEHPELAARVASYRAGYLPEERRAIERDLVDGTLYGIAATTALELGIDIGGLDACVLAGYPGTIAGMWQQAGRAGRAQQRSLAVLVAQDDPLDQYMVAHPAELFGRPHESAVIDPDNPHILDAHLACAAFEQPLSDTDEVFFGPAFAAACARVEAAGLLRPRGGRRFWTGRGSPAHDIGLRSAGRQVRIVEEDTGRLLGTAEGARAGHTVHTGAMYLHQGEQFEVSRLDLDAAVALVHSSNAAHYTQVRDVTDIRIEATERTARAGRVTMCFGNVVVSNRVVGYVRRRLYTNETIDEVLLDMPEQTLQTKAAWYTVPPPLLHEAGLTMVDVPGAIHAAEHAAIGVMPLFAMCDRWDIGGVSTPGHQDTGECTVFIYDGYPGGAGFSERSFLAGAEHLRVTLETITACPCERGCPSCVQSPKCGNGNDPLDKHGAIRLLATILDSQPPPEDRASVRAGFV